MQAKTWSQKDYRELQVLREPEVQGLVHFEVWNRLEKGWTSSFRKGHGLLAGLRNPQARNHAAQESVQVEQGRSLRRTPKSCAVSA